MPTMDQLRDTKAQLPNMELSAMFARVPSAKLQQLSPFPGRSCGREGRAFKSWKSEYPPSRPHALRLGTQTGGAGNTQLDARMAVSISCQG